VFQNWFRTIYLQTKYPAYILRKAHMLPGGGAEAKMLAGIYQPPAIEDHRQGDCFNGALLSLGAFRRCAAPPA
jgi:hypothetical protein